MATLVITRNILKKISWGIVAVLSSMLVLMTSVTLLSGEQFELFTSKSSDLQDSFFYTTLFYAHITGGAIALLSGWLQFYEKLRRKRPAFHRVIGKIYVLSILVSGLSGIYIALFAYGGLISSLGFTGMGITWVYTTSMAVVFARAGKISKHQRMMYLSYSLCFAAVTFRIWNPLLALWLEDPINAYRISAWTSWVLNLLIAYSVSLKIEH